MVLESDGEGVRGHEHPAAGLGGGQQEGEGVLHLRIICLGYCDHLELRLQIPVPV